MPTRLLPVAFIALCAAILPGQSVARAVSPQGVQSKTSPSAPGLRARISIRLKEVPFSEALETIARQAELNITIARGARIDKTVTYQAKDVTAEVAFRTVLAGTVVRMSVTPEGQVVFTPTHTPPSSVQGVITGKVIDGKTKQPIQGAAVTVEGTSLQVRTGEDGRYHLADVMAGSYGLSVRMIGYAKYSQRITVDEGATIAIDVALEASANVLDQMIVTGTIVSTELKAVPSAITVVTAKQIEERGITKIDQLFRGDVPGLFAQNLGASALLDEVTMFSRGATALSTSSVGVSQPIVGVPVFSNPIKTYLDGVELADPQYLSQIDPKSIDRIEILTGPQASTIYGSNAINGVMQIFTKRGSTSRPQLTLNLLSGWVENDFSTAHTPQHDYSSQVSGLEGRLSYNAGGSWNYVGAWTPGKQLARLGGFGGAKLDLHTPAGQVAADMTLRRTTTQSIQRGSPSQSDTYFRETGWWAPTSFSGLAQPTTRTLMGQTIGLQLSYAPMSWWSHELGLGTDVADTERRATEPAYVSPADTTLRLEQIHADRRSMRYATTARIPLAAMAQLTITAGADAWQNLTSALSLSPQTLTGSLTNVTTLSRRPGHNTGGFVQSQLGFSDRFFVTYGLRMEKNPTIGEKARVIPGRYGVAYTQDMGFVTAKLRGSYGRSIRPPAPTRKDAVPQTSTTLIPLYGMHDLILANPNLAPEHQQGGEGGVELYFGTRGSLVVTRYNQTVDQLIANVSRIDSVRSLAPCLGTDASCFASSSSRDAQGHSFRYQNQYMNLGSIRNQGWELQSSVAVGPVTTRGTYSWTKSRVIGVTPTYRAAFAANAAYQPGATFQYLPEHTWALGVTYARARSSVALNVMGVGRLTNGADDFYFENLASQVRLLEERRNVGNPNAYINFNDPYALADLTASHRFSPRVEAVLQVQNLADRYINDYYAAYPSLGRQIKAGVRLRSQ